MHLHNPREFATDRHRKVDDEPYGGGAGMVLKPEPVFAAMESVPRCPRSRVLLMSPQGRPVTAERSSTLVAGVRSVGVSLWALRRV
jgi:2-C-methyl-D-erythritol 2,4-cyclodiphosphate synthase